MLKSPFGRHVAETLPRLRRIALAASLLLFSAASSEAARRLPAAPSRQGSVRTVALASLPLSTLEQGYGKPQVDRSVDGHPLTLGGRRYSHGLGTHSPGSFVLDLKRNAVRFTATVGIDDETNGRGSAEFQIVGDGKVLWRSGVLRGGQPPKDVVVDLVGVRRLALLVDDAGDGFEYDHADWAEANFTMKGEDPKPARILVADPDIALPRTDNRPVITSPAIFGVRAGTPILYNICAAGAPPFRFSATGLPPGVALDAETGRLTGTLSAAGEHTFTVTARNRSGADTRRIRLVVGDTIALTPPLGWNSYDCYGDNVTEDEILANAAYIREHLRPHGWEYVIVDYRWYDPNARTPPNNPNSHADSTLSADAFGRLTPAPNRFPSAAGGRGFAPLAERMHAMGLKFGIHVMRGIPRQTVKANRPIEGSPYRAAEAANTASTCPWCPDMYGVAANTPAGQAWYDALLRQYAAWGVDYIKVDDMSAPYSAGEIEAVHGAIEKCGRSIVLSLSPGDTPLDRAGHVARHANLWRISGDFWDNWGAVNHQFDLAARWLGKGGPGAWPDADMIPLGHLSLNGRSVGSDRRAALTRHEQLTLMSLWAVAPSPLMLGMVLPDNDPWTLALLSNDEVLAVNQDPLGKQAEVLQGPEVPAGIQVWTKALADGSRAVCVFNRLNIPVNAQAGWSLLGLAAPSRARDLWLRKDIAADRDGIRAELAPHGALMLRVWPKPR